MQKSQNATVTRLKLVVMSSTDRTTHNNPLFYSSCWRPLHYSPEKIKTKKAYFKGKILSRLLILAAGQNKKATLIFQGKEEKMN